MEENKCFLPKGPYININFIIFSNYFSLFWGFGVLGNESNGRDTNLNCAFKESL